MFPGMRKVSDRSGADANCPGDARQVGRREAVVMSQIPVWALRREGTGAANPTPSRLPRVEMPADLCPADASLPDPGLGHLLTVSEAATILHVSTKTVRRLIARRELDGVRIGRSLRLRPEDISDLIFGNSNK